MFLVLKVEVKTRSLVCAVAWSEINIITAQGRLYTRAARLGGDLFFFRSQTEKLSKLQLLHGSNVVKALIL